MGRKYRSSLHEKKHDAKLQNSANLKTTSAILCSFTYEFHTAERLWRCHFRFHTLPFGAKLRLNEKGWCSKSAAAVEQGGGVEIRRNAGPWVKETRLLSRSHPRRPVWKVGEVCILSCAGKCPRCNICVNVCICLHVCAMCVSQKKKYQEDFHLLHKNYTWNESLQNSASWKQRPLFTHNGTKFCRVHNVHTNTCTHAYTHTRIQTFMRHTFK